MKAATAVLCALAAILAAGCTPGTKSGGKTAHEISIVMQTPDAPEPDAEYFIAQAKARSHGRIQILEGTDYSSSDPDNEARLVQDLRTGKVDMAYIPSRAWARRSSVTAFRALQAPLLVTNYPLLRRITTGSIGSGMLESLSRIDVLGLGLVPDELRRAFGRKPLASPAAFRGARIRVVTSPTSVLALKSLGAIALTNYTSPQLGAALRSGRLDGAELSTVAITNNGYVPRDARYLTANLALFAKTQTIAIRKSVFDRLSPADQAILRAAAVATVAHANPSKQERTELIQLCREGLQLVHATGADLASLAREASTVYPALERDAETRREMGAIERLKRQLGAVPSALPSCASQTSPAGTSTKTLSGTYVLTASRSAIAAFPGSGVTDNWGSFRLVFQGNRFRLSDSRPGGESAVGPPGGSTAGRYALNGDRITFTQSSGAGDTPLGVPGNDPIVCSWSRYRDTLTFRRLGSKDQLAATAKGLDALGPPLLYVKPWRRVS